MCLMLLTFGQECRRPGMKKINLNELTLDNIDQWPLPAKAGAIAIVSLLVILIGYWFIAKGNFEQYEVLKKEESELKNKFEFRQRQASNLMAYRDQMQKMQERFGNMLRKLPTENEMPGLLEDISKTGIATGLSFELFAPKSEVPHDFYIEVPIEIAVVGGYHELAVFLSRVAQLDRIVTIHDIVIEHASKERQRGKDEMVLVMKMTAKIYRYNTLDKTAGNNDKSP